MPNSARRDHTEAEITALESATGLQLLGYLDMPPLLLPILARPNVPQARRRELVAKLNDRTATTTKGAPADA